MRSNFSPQRRGLVWRDLWIALAETEKELGLPIADAAIEEMRAARDSIDLDRVAEIEKDLRHDVMAHVHAFGESAPAASGILHLGATSCFITDNADLILIREAMKIVRGRLLGVMRALRAFAEEHRDLPVLAFTHFQSAQPTTLGKRACLWLQDFLIDLEEIERLIAWLPLRSAKGTTGTQASYLQLFEGDHAKVRALETRLTERLGFPRSIPVSGQTYTRKIDGMVLHALAGVAASASKFAADLRLLAHRRELEEPFGKKQIGSSAMPYKRNPMRSERISALSRYLLHLAPNALDTAANQWLERTLDDSANRRLAIPESFLAADAILLLVQDVASGLLPQPQVLARNLQSELPFMATESILMAAVQAGGDRQQLHERIRVHSHEAAERLKAGDGVNDLLDRLAADDAFASVRDRLDGLCEPSRFVGRAPEQVDEFLAEQVDPLLCEREQVAAAEGEVRV